MKCTLCGCEFREESAKSACAGCPVSRGCDLVCCPNCGFEMPVEPRWLAKIRKWMKGKRNEAERQV